MEGNESHTYEKSYNLDVSLGHATNRPNALRVVIQDN